MSAFQYDGYCLRNPPTAMCPYDLLKLAYDVNVSGLYIIGQILWYFDCLSLLKEVWSNISIK